MARLPVRAAVLTAPNEPLQIRTLHLDAPGPGEVLVRTTAAGLCHSDLHYMLGTQPIPLPAVLGHEVTGVVESVGSGVHRVGPGDHVVATITPNCGACGQCVAGFPTRCERVAQMRLRDKPLLVDELGGAVTSLGAIGGFAEAIVVLEAALAVVEDSLDPRVACLLGCCISTGVGAVLHGAPVGPSDTVAVIGCGGVGIAAIQAARMSGARRVVALDVHEDKLELARRFGATDVVLSAGDHARDAVLALMPGGVTRVFEAVGRPETAELAFSLLRSGGVATILGLMPPGSRIAVDAAALIEGDRRLQGAYMGMNRFMADVGMLLDQHRAGRLDLGAMVTRVLPFADLNDGFRAMGSPDSIRTVITFQQEG